MGMIKLSKTKKIAIASVAGLVVLLAIVLPLSIGNSDSKSEMSAASTSNGGMESDATSSTGTGTETGSNNNDMDTGRTDNVFDTENVFEDGGALAPPEIEENCPCFTADSLDTDISRIASGLFTFTPDETCTGSATGTDGIFYSDPSDKNPAPMGVQVLDGECWEGDSVYLTDESQNASCRQLLAAKCSEHSSTLSLTAAKDACVHFDADDISLVVGKLNSGLVTPSQFNCPEASIGFSSTLSWTEGGRTRMYSTNFDQANGDYQVMVDDQIFTTDAVTKNACSALVDDACKSLYSVKIADGCEFFSKFDMDGIVEAINGGLMVASSESCPEYTIGGSSQTLSWYEDQGDGSNIFRTFSASWDESLSKPVVKVDDQVHTVEMDVMQSCAAVINTACNEIKKKPGDGVISINGAD